MRIFGPTLAREKLMQWHQASVSKGTLRKWMTVLATGEAARDIGQFQPTASRS